MDSIDLLKRGSSAVPTDDFQANIEISRLISDGTMTDNAVGIKGIVNPKLISEFTSRSHELTDIVRRVVCVSFIT